MRWYATVRCRVNMKKKTTTTPNTKKKERIRWFFLMNWESIWQKAVQFKHWSGYHIHSLLREQKSIAPTQPLKEVGKGWVVLSIADRLNNLSVIMVISRPWSRRYPFSEIELARLGLAWKRQLGPHSWFVNRRSVGGCLIVRSIRI